jgi:hypothetical protein
MSQATRNKNEFLGSTTPVLPTCPPARSRRRAGQQPRVDKEKASELVRAGTTLTVIFLLVAVAVTALY